MPAPAAPPTGGVLALDLARITGWAYAPLSWNRPRFGTWHLPETGGEGLRLMAFENELIEAILLFEPADIVMEAPMRFLPVHRDRHGRMKIDSSRAAMWQQIGLRAMVKMQAVRNCIPVTEVSPDIVRSEILGFSRVPGQRGAIKFHVIRWCRANGMPVDDDNDADACMIWEWHRRRIAGPRQTSMVETAA